ncbi:UNVERIFIED_CONTAM: hypothetical protein HDU68_008343 [Siphonaria sp. JEL0065]|nr:hypothetical protein HDU68_008343 [Siphonaria sp. JEL0065]
MSDRSMSPSSLSDNSSTAPVATGRRYPCKSCDKDFSTSGQLSRHNRIHKGIKKFQCDVPGCIRIFFRADNREQHSKSHKRRLQKQSLRESEAIACRILSAGVRVKTPPHQSIQSTPPRTPVFENKQVFPHHQQYQQPPQPVSYYFPIPQQTQPQILLPSSQVHCQLEPQSKTSIQFLCD